MIALVLWELHTDKPIINLRLFRYKNFAICCFLMMLVGGVLNANTVLQPRVHAATARLQRHHRGHWRSRPAASRW